MQTALLDSSVWIPLFTNDFYSEEAFKIVVELSKYTTKVLLPAIVYAEVINCLKRFKVQRGKIDKIKKFFHENKNIQIVYPHKDFWLKKVEKYAEKVRLKTLDLLILIFALELKVDKFYSFDGRLNKAYDEQTN